MRCTVCKKTSEEIKLFSGILFDEMVMICEECADSEGVPIIKKPSELQLDKADEKYSVRERMERMSGMHDTVKRRDNTLITQGNLAKLRIPPKKEYHEDVLDNYYWTLNLARRRSKLSIDQLAELTKIDANTLKSIEKGKIPENFTEIFLKLEIFLKVKLLKNHKNKLNFIRSVEKEKEILDIIRKKIDLSKSSRNEDAEQAEKKEQLEKISKGEMDFSKRDNISNITLDDLVSLKKVRESKLAKIKIKAREDAMIGDDLELEIEEL